ncbi:SDR family NAD(P)-dependent oxidoreductase [Actinomadura sp. 9N215]|uniref:SDR family NAD(P)-dependent oxidoreductase n=1 Tax=Actinomadura sp. 9N215 TaxID=3375150 RepID=UPI00378CF825
MRLLCLPYAGGGTTAFRGWAELLPDIEVVAVQLPGREARADEPPAVDVDDLVDAALTMTDRPYAVFGHSMGGILGFELCRRLRRVGAPPPAWFFVGGSPVPHTPLSRPRVAEMTDDELTGWLAGLGGAPRDLLDDPAMRAVWLPILRSDFAFTDDYRFVAEEPFGCPITAFAGDADAMVGADEMSGWRAHTSSDFALRVLPGDHFFPHTARRELLASIAQDLRNTGRAAKPIGRPGAADVPPDEPIAVIGMSGRFPGAHDLDAYWQNLIGGVESIRRYSLDEQISLGVPADVARHPAFVPAASVLDGADRFDAAFFGLTPREAEIRDPQHRLLLETAHTALEHAGYDPARFAGDIGVFAGTGRGTYGFEFVRPNRAVVESVGTLAVSSANDPDFLATFVSHRLNLRGPSMTVQTACSTSLVAVHLAVEALRRGDCGVALAGASSIVLPHGHGYLYQEGGVVSPDGHCRPFDADARGTIWGSGAGVVVLKPLSAALADGDTVHAVVLGSAVNNDGSAKQGFSAPGVDGQAAVAERALARAGVDPETVTYVEAHGTATALGDPVEVEALSRAYGAGTSARQWCGIGSVKSNIGHLISAAGIAGLIKTVLALKGELIPRTLHAERPNPRIGFADGPFRVVSALTPWPRGPEPRRAGVSAFGIGGTNAHLIVEEPPARAAAPPPRPSWQLLPLSANTETALDDMIVNLGAHLLAEDDLPLADVAHTLQVGRAERPHRAVLVAQDGHDAGTALTDNDRGRLRTGLARGTGGPPAFLFPGQGAQYPGMGSGLYAAYPVFRSAVDRCADLLAPHLDGLDLRDHLLADTADEHAQQTRHARQALDQTELAQPALFTVQYALAELLRSWGVRPAAMLGHSVGELTAACLAGVFSLPDALALVAARGRLMQRMPAGAMLAVALPEDEAAALLPPELSVAAVNAPGECVVAGPSGAVDAFAATLAAHRTPSRRLRTSHAFHSAMMDPVLDEFADVVAKVPRNRPDVPFLSCVTGDWITAEQAIDPAYWARHLREPVRFGECAARLLGAADRTAVEVGPGSTLTELVRPHVRADGALPSATLPSAASAGDDQDCATLLRAVGDLWLRGVPVDWPAISGPGRHRVPLPTYPFERRRYWVDAPEPTATTATTAPTAPDGERWRTVDDWYEVPGWRQASPIPRPASPSDLGLCLLLRDEDDPGEALAGRLRDAGAAVVTVLPGSGYERHDDETFTVNPADWEDHRRVLDALAEDGRAAPPRIVAAWGLIPPPAPDTALTRAEAETAQDRTFFGLLALAQALAESPDPAPAALDVVTAHAQDVDGTDLLRPELALAAGVCRVLPLEAPHLTCRHIDTDLRDGALDHLITELTTTGTGTGTFAGTGTGEPVVALRNGRRWTPTHTRVPLPPEAGGDPADGWRERGVYLITGGLGGLGITIAEHLARRVRARLALLTRSAFPGRASWDAWLAEHGPGDRMSRAVQAIRRMEEAGAEVAVHTADVTDPEALQRVRSEIRARFGEVDGIVHAAGVPGGGLIEVKRRDTARAVLAPKVAGTLALAEVFGDLPLDVLALCSSVTAIAGGLGQSDYCAANAFMDAYARSPRGIAAPASRDGTPRNGTVVSVNWGAWLDVGMAAEVGMPYGHDHAGTATDAHPWLTAHRHGPSGSDVFKGTMSSTTHWVLDEHRVQGTPVLPGTAHLDLMRAAFIAAVNGTQDATVAVELRDIAFAAPLAAPDGETVDFEVVVGAGTESRPIAVRTVDATGHTVDHAHSTARAVVPESVPPRDITAIRERCTSEYEPATPHRRGSAVTLGPRWSGLVRTYAGPDEALAILSAPGTVVSDGLTVHPALLDEAIAADAGRHDRDHLPIGYGRVVIRGPLPARAFSHVRHQPDRTDGLRVMDVAILDESGQEILSIDDVILREFDADSLPTFAPPPAEPPAQPPVSLAHPPASPTRRPGITPADGAEALRRLLAAGLGPQVVVSAVPIDEISARVRQADRHSMRTPASGDAILADPPDRSVLGDYVAPHTDLEAALAELWADVLGVGDIGVEDDFFELGGTSLVAVQLIWRAGDLLGDPPSMRTLFESPTVAGMASAIEQSSSHD